MSLKSTHKFVRGRASRYGKRGSYGEGVNITKRSQGSHPFASKPFKRNQAKRKFGKR